MECDTVKNSDTEDSIVYIDAYGVVQSSWERQMNKGLEF